MAIYHSMATSEIPIAQVTNNLAGSSPAVWDSVKEYLPTFLTEFAVMASQVAVYKMAAAYLGKEGFSEYALARRTVSLIFPIPVLGLAVGLPRNIGISHGRNDPDTAARYYGATLWCVGGAALVCAVLLNTFAGTFGYVFFGDRGYGRLALPVSLLILGLCLHTVVCGYFRGHLKLGPANLLQFLNLAVLPMLAFCLRHSLRTILTGLGLAWIATAATALWLTPFHVVMQNNWKEAKELMRYGLQRVPGDFILMALFTLPATVVAHLWGVREAGFVAFGISVVSMIGAVFSPTGLVLLPKATRMIAEEQREKLREHVGLILRVTVTASVALVGLIWVAMPVLIRAYFGADFSQIVPIVRVLLLAALPYSVYLVARNLVDAYHKDGVTAAILFAGLSVFGVGLYWATKSGLRLQTVLLDFVAAQVVICLLAGWECQRILRKQETAIP